jgi:hypothetical protein
VAKWGGEKDDKWAERGEGGGRRRVDDREGTQLGRVEVIQRAARRRDRETGKQGRFVLLHFLAKETESMRVGAKESARTAADWPQSSVRVRGGARAELVLHASFSSKLRPQEARHLTG